MRSKTLLAVIATLAAGAAIALVNTPASASTSARATATATATASDEHWSAGTGAAPTSDVLRPRDSGLTPDHGSSDTADGHLTPLHQGKAPWAITTAGATGDRNRTGVDPDYPLGKNLEALANKY
ncbi:MULTISPECIES: hypothetical protein [Streptomyces]